MRARECPICGENGLWTLKGIYEYEPPPNVEGGVMIIPNAEWEECGDCGEQILSPELNRALEREAVERRATR